MENKIPQILSLQDEVTEIGKEQGQARDGMEQIRSNIRRLMDKRKLRLNMEDRECLTTQSAPTFPAANGGVFDLPWDEEKARFIKRRREDKSTSNIKQEEAGDTEKLVVTIRRVIKKIEKEIKTIAIYTQEKNTKKEIKESTANLMSIISQITTDESSILLQSLGKNM